MIRFKLIKFLLLMVFGLLFVFSNDKAYGYVCADGRWCADTGNPSGVDGYLWGYKKVLGDCYSHDWPYNCTGTDSNCSGGEETYSTYELCMAGGEEDLHVGCCTLLSCSSCTPNPSCPNGTTTTNTGDSYSTDTDCCSTGPSPCPENCDTESCYCNLCDIDSVSCDDLDDNDQSWGSYPQYKSCRNTPVGDKCDTRYKTCYCYEPPEPPLCPTPLLDSSPVLSPNMVLEKFTYTYNICSVYKYHDCFETPSPQPTERLTIYPDAQNDYNFTSDTHTGVPLGGRIGNLNDPIRMQAEYTDVDGASDIEALSVWFRDDASTGEVQSPIWMSTTAAPDAPSNGSWGFMMVKESGAWVPYVPSWAPATPVWTRAVYTNSGGIINFVISGSSRGNMVAVTITAPITSSGDTVTMPFTLRFSGTNIVESVSQTTYKILLMGLDVFSFTPYDNYTFPASDNWPSTVEKYWPVNKLRYRSEPLVAQTYARDWFFTDRRWTVDKVNPEIHFINNTPSVTSVMGNTLKIEWNATDDKSLYAIVGNIYTTAGVGDVSGISIVESTGGVSLQYPLNEEFIPTAVSDPGRLNSGWTFRVDPNISVTSHTGSITIDVGSNREGSVLFYLTVFDDAGNISMPIESGEFDLDDWLVTDGGLGYSFGGSTFETKIFTDDPGWAGILPPFGVSSTESLLYNLADLSTEMWADGSSTQTPLSLTKSGDTGSFNIRNFKGTKITSYYDNFLKAFERTKPSIEGLKESIIAGDVTIDSQLTNNNYCGNPNSYPYCVLRIEGNLTVNGNGNLFRCTNRAVIFVGGNLTVIPPIINSVPDPTSATYGCIFIVSGNVGINEGEDAASNEDFAYDVINAYILADGNITMEHEVSKMPIVDEDTIDDADNVSLWTSSDPTNTPISQEVGLYTEETGSIEIHTSSNTINTTLDLMEYATDADARAAYVGSGGSVLATGGSVSSVGEDRIHTFTSSGTLNVTSGGDVRILLIGGGGAGGSDNLSAGGGGGGGVVSESSYTLGSGCYSITIGTGGSRRTPADGANGGNGGSTRLGSLLTANGGGGGGGGWANGSNGGSGGGAGYSENGTKYGGSGSQGGKGGNGTAPEGAGVAGRGGGGGGASATNYSGTTSSGGNGGAGFASSISGSSVYYAGGGGGGSDSTHIASGGSGGGGTGGNRNRRPGVGTNGFGGGGGGDAESELGGRGGSGVAIIRYLWNNGIAVYSEPSIKQQGSYALKVAADQTTSLNKTLTRTISTPINLSNHTEISFYLRSSRSGSNIKVGFRDSGGAIREVTPNVTTANTYQLVTLDISGVSNVNKDAINQIVITITNADASNTFYIDNIRASLSASRNDTVSITKVRRDMWKYDQLTFWVRSTEIGQTMRFQFGEDSNSERTYDITINTANTWEKKTWDISSIPRNARDGVRFYAFQLINMGDNQSFYFDDIRNSNSAASSVIDVGEVIDGVYINGGLQSFGSGQSIIMNRYLRLEERLRFPVLVVDYHPKYGMIAEKILGNTYTLQKTEVGFKP